MPTGFIPVQTLHQDSRDTLEIEVLQVLPQQHRKITLPSATRPMYSPPVRVRDAAAELQRAGRV
jgi:hypothetical protein